jgi:hypothetical protein
LHHHHHHHHHHRKVPFPFKLHEMLSDAAKEGTEDIVSWQPHGMAFRVHKTKEFTETVMQRYFHQTHYKSFQRQLHIYGFRRFAEGVDRGSYYHPMFVKGKDIVSLRMTRCKIKGPLARVAVEEPNFYHLAESVGSGVVSMASPDQERSNDQVGSSSTFFLSTGPFEMLSSTSCADPVLSKALSLPTLQFSATRLSQESSEEQPKLRHTASCVGVTHQTHMMMLLRDEISAHNVLFGGNDSQTKPTSMLPDDFQPLPWNRTLPNRNRRMSLLEEGDEAFFAGKKFFFVEKPSVQPTLPTRSTVERRPVWASGA